MRSYVLPFRVFPQGSTKVADKLSDAVVYLYDLAGGRCGAVAYHGKSNKADWHYSFRSTAAREAAVRRHFEGRRSSLAAKKQRADERKAYVNDYQVGDILNTCWGYEQTNVEYFEVVEVKGAHVIVRQIGKIYEATGLDTGKSGPMPGNFVGEPLRRKATKDGIKIGDCRWASRSTFQQVGTVKVYLGHYESSYA